jgi:hypothetical protein
MTRATEAFERLAHKRAVDRKCSRRYRQRRRNGIRTLRIEISNWTRTVAAFVKAGLLSEDQRADPDPVAVEKIIAQLCRRGFAALVAEQAAAAPRPAAPAPVPQMPEANRRLLASLET